MRSIAWQIILTILSQVDAKIVLNENWKGSILKLPPIRLNLKERNVPVLKTINQTVDHFADVSSTFEQRYGENLDFYNGSGPMVVFISGEQSLYNEISYLYTGLAYDLAKQTGAAFYMLEHRYYGASFPNGTFNSRNYLRVNQALADIAYFIQYKKTEHSGIGKVIVVGGSYTATLAAWARQTYPNIIDAAIASSGIFNIKRNNYEYYEVLQKSLKQYDGCIEVVEDGFTKIKKYLRTYRGIVQVEKEFQTTIPLLKTLVSPVYKRYLIDYLVMTPISYTVQYDQMIGYISEMCGNFTANNSLSSTQKIANFANTFWNTPSSDNTSYPSATSDGISWNYQVCVELGNFPTTTSQNQPFYNVHPLWYFYYNCARNVNILSPMLLQYYNRKLTKTYGGTNMNLTKVVFTVGSVDPWSGIGLSNELNAEAPVVTAEGSSHCAVLAPASVVNSTALTNARNKVISIVKQWIQ